MQTTKLLSLILALTFLSSCTSKHEIIETSKHDSEETHQQHWSYSGETSPKNWSHIKEEYLACDGSSQSPIDIDTKSVIKSQDSEWDLSLNYMESPIDIINNGHTVEFLISGENNVSYKEKKYELKQFHMHTESEHTIDGKHLPLEFHFVNKAEDDTYLVISVLFIEGEESELLNHYLSHFPKHEGEYVEEGKLNIMDVMPCTAQYYHYKGSFTTPPCTETVDWIILQEKATASKLQLESLHDILKNNYRPIQKLNNRTITLN